MSELTVVIRRNIEWDIRSDGVLLGTVRGFDQSEAVTAAFYKFNLDEDADLDLEITPHV